MRHHTTNPEQQARDIALHEANKAWKNGSPYNVPDFFGIYEGIYDASRHHKLEECAVLASGACVVRK